MSCESYPREIKDSLVNFSRKIDNLNSAILPLIESNGSQLTKDLTALETVKLNLTTSLTINSLYWAFLSTQGIDPKKNALNEEIKRIHSCIKQIQEIENKKKAPKLAKEAVKRFISHSLYDHAERKKARKEEEKMKKTSDDTIDLKKTTADAKEEATPDVEEEAAPDMKKEATPSIKKKKTKKKSSSVLKLTKKKKKKQKS